MVEPAKHQLKYKTTTYNISFNFLSLQPKRKENPLQFHPSQLRIQLKNRSNNFYVKQNTQNILNKESKLLRYLHSEAFSAYLCQLTEI